MGLDVLKKPVIILGGPNTATSSLVGVLNSHPQCLVLFETDIACLDPTKYAKRLLSAEPGFRSIIRHHADAADAYAALLAQTRRQGHDFVMTGDKLPYFSRAAFDKFRNFKIIYSVRNPAEWLAKVAEFFAATNDVRPLLVEYLSGLLSAKAAADCLIVPFDEFLADNPNVVSRMFAFCGLEPAPESFTWWQTVGQYADPYRSSQKWWLGHGSSLVAPTRNDTRVARLPHPAWAVVDAAFAQANSLVQGAVSPAECVRLTDSFDSALGAAPIAITDLMKHETRRLGVRRRTFRKIRELVSSRFSKADQAGA